MRPSVRLHAVLHSCFVMCVVGSQNSMQSFKVLPPPPAALGAPSLRLPGDKANVPCLGRPPLDGVLGDCCDDKGAMLGTGGAGVPIADAGGGAAMLGAGCGGARGVSTGCAGVDVAGPAEGLPPDRDCAWAAPARPLSVKLATTTREKLLEGCRRMPNTTVSGHTPREPDMSRKRLEA